NKLFIQKVEEKVVKEDLSYREAETEIFSFDHAQVGALLVKKWNFSQELEKVIEFHHEPYKAKGIVELAAITNFSDKLCNKLRIGFKKDASIVLEELESAVILNLQLPRVTELENELMQALAEEEHF
ncbi:MAG TPA: HDOD domain-containing protein, partial [candidate division Zixibacteria bacterium]